ncbi:hypothetical protein [Nonomuraea sp. NPDC049141]|uniref:hypothetical protein n=1 Tax=Nonomuraea sp. NPDC049141 TaxID=3155500 RepID=UPI0033F4F005
MKEVVDKPVPGPTVERLITLTAVPSTSSTPPPSVQASSTARDLPGPVITLHETGPTITISVTITQPQHSAVSISPRITPVPARVNDAGSFWGMFCLLMVVLLALWAGLALHKRKLAKEKAKQESDSAD